ncbi:ABC-type transport auxiliary lipoprotein family protein [Alsobacter sp. SYSU BS001988]
MSAPIAAPAPEPNPSLAPLRPARPWILAGLFTAALGLTGCGSSPSETFDLTIPSGAARQNPGRSQIVVAEPVALQALESDRIVVRSADGSVSSVGGVQWSDRLPRLLQTRLVQAFENAGRAVGRAGTGINADQVLQTEIRFFGVSTVNGAEAVAELSVKIVASATGKITASRVFKGSVPLAAVGGREAAVALDKAAQRVFADVVRWAR